MLKTYFSGLTPLVLGVWISLASSANAQITGTFVGAQDGVNSFSADDGVSLFSASTQAAAQAGSLWWDRGPDWRIQGIAESGGFTAQRHTNPPYFREIVTVIDGLQPFLLHDIYIQSAANAEPFDSGNQNIQAGFTSGDLTTFMQADGRDTGLGLAGVASPWFVQEHFVGQIAADANGEIRVFVNAGPAPVSTTERSHYHGVSFVAIPEPSSLLLLAGLSATAMLRRRK